MIKIDVADYCHECKCFEADVVYPKLVHINGTKMYFPEDVLVRCEYREKCAHAVRFVEEKDND